MPSPNRDGNTSRIAYTRWEPLVAEDAEASENNNVEFHHFQEESQVPVPKVNGSPLRLAASAASTSSIVQPRNRRRSRGNQNHCIWEWGVRVLGILVIIGVSWIMGFMTRWGLHHYFIDSQGHCVTPVPYHFDPETAKLIMDEVDLDNIKSFLNDFTSIPQYVYLSYIV